MGLLPPRLPTWCRGDCVQGGSGGGKRAPARPGGHPRAQAETLACEHEAQSQHWNTGQAAITQLQRLAAALPREHGPEPDALMLAMSLVPGRPPELRRELEAGKQ
jgi:hypothetical protein